VIASYVEYIQYYTKLGGGVEKKEIELGHEKVEATDAWKKGEGSGS
jgi:hypothetical protein